MISIQYAQLVGAFGPSRPSDVPPAGRNLSMQLGQLALTEFEDVSQVTPDEQPVDDAAAQNVVVDDVAAERPPFDPYRSRREHREPQPRRRDEFQLEGIPEELKELLAASRQKLDRLETITGCSGRRADLDRFLDHLMR